MNLAGAAKPDKPRTSPGGEVGLEPDDLRSWDTARVGAWLCTNGFSQHAETFDLVGVDGAMLAGITMVDLEEEELGICKRQRPSPSPAPL